MCDEFISDRLQIIKKHYMEANNNTAIFFLQYIQLNANEWKHSNAVILLNRKKLFNHLQR